MKMINCSFQTKKRKTEKNVPNMINEFSVVAKLSNSK